jgi:hypothetical protein
MSMQQSFCSDQSPAATASALETLAARLEKLERQRRILGAIVALSLGLAVVAFFRASPSALADRGGKPDERVVRTQRLVLVDGKGTQRAVLGVDEKWPGFETGKGKEKGAVPQPGLYLRDAKGKPRLALVAGEDDAGMQLLDGAGKAALVLVTAKDRQTLLGFNDSRGVTRGLVGIGKDGKPVVILRGNGALMGINDMTGTTRALVGTDKDGDGVVVIQDRTGKAIAQMP